MDAASSRRLASVCGIVPSKNPGFLEPGLRLVPLQNDPISADLRCDSGEPDTLSDTGLPDDGLRRFTKILQRHNYR